ncbi:hypothetical protein DID88_000992 [Monilinia fructigena]|uniref:Multifunctional fusion protein n=1 Tax=Monilinia fructigena TaxID=38457 RepID=A0A395IYU5_9HELO|nr:hypothetical protein DID88_000992 [Monilinia fructigena]
MAFGQRNTSRGGRGGGGSSFRGRGGSRGGPRGRGGGRGGRGRGRGRPIFDSARLAQKEEEEENDSGSEESSQDEAMESEEESSDDEDDEEPAPAVKSYAALMQKRKKPDEEVDPVDQDANDADHVEEAEEGPETAIDGQFEDDDEEDNSDPFETHFANPDDNVLSRRLQHLEKGQWAVQRSILAKVGKAITSIPDYDEPKQTKPISTSSPEELKLKQKLAGVIKKQCPAFDALEKSISPLIFWVSRFTVLTRDRVIKNNSRLAREESSDDLELRDQGFTRPKVLMILPTRESCRRKYSTDKAEDFRELFAGNDDDMFRLGLKFTRKTIKYFSQFYNSDIIFASPLGLRMAIGNEDAKKVDHDFLSSIEMVIVDQADALLMQNWEHVEFIFDHLNLQPKEAHGCDFSRVRSWYLDNNSKYFRQTIALASFNTPELNTMFYNQSKNWEGKVKVSSSYPGAIQELGLKVKQTFSRLDSQSFSSDPDSRFEYFTSAIIPTLTRRTKSAFGASRYACKYGFYHRFTGGVTLTLSLAYLTVLAHQRNRTTQSIHLHHQSQVLTSLLEKQPIPPPKSRSELAREERSTLIEAAKDRWNAEIENGNLKDAEAKIPSYPEIERKAGGTVDAARGSIRNAVSRGIEAGRDIAQKAGAAVGIAEQKVEEKVALVSGSGKSTDSGVERALRGRFEGPSQLERVFSRHLMRDIPQLIREIMEP